MITIDKEFLDHLFEQAEENPRKRINFDMRTSSDDNSQRMLNAMLPGTEVAVHRHPASSENVICISGKLDEVIYEEITEEVTAIEDFEKGMDTQDICCCKVLREVERIHLNPSKGEYGGIVPAGVWHTVEVFEPTVIYEAKDGKYGEDGSEVYNVPIVPAADIPKSVVFSNAIGDLKKNVEYILGKERTEGNIIDEITPEYISKLLHANENDVRKVLNEIQ